MHEADDLQRSVGRIEGKLDSLIDLHRTTTETVLAHSGRISRLENFKSRALGGAAAIAGTASIVYAIITLIK
jgi:hypothetical protein